jgi:exosortase A
MQFRRAEASAAAVLLLIALVVLAHAPVAHAMVQTWTTRDAYAHGFFVVPVVAGWVWLRRPTLAALPVQPAWPGLAVLLVLACAAIVLDAIGVNAPRQFVLVAMVPATVAAVLGTAWVRALAFPLAYLFFAVPAGDVFVPVLTDWTADAVVAGLRMLDIPVFREADRISIPSGHWLVAEACAGLRYLVACTAVGTVYAAAMYRSAWRRIAFIAAMMVAAVVANWARAFAIVLLAHATNNRLAVGIDHFIYGWVMFGAIVAAMFWLGGRWQQPPERAPAPLRPAADAKAGRAVPAALLALLLAALPAGWAAWGSAPQPLASAELDVMPAGAWRESSERPAGWQPRLVDPAQRFGASYTDGQAAVTLELAVWRGGGKAYSSANQLVASSDDRWHLIERGSVVLAGVEGAVPAAAIRSNGDSERLVVWRLYAVDGLLTGSPWRAAAAAAAARLAGRDTASAWISIATPADDGQTLAPDHLAGFWTTMRAPIQAALAAPAMRTAQQAAE